MMLTNVRKVDFPNIGVHFCSSHLYWSLAIHCCCLENIIWNGVGICLYASLNGFDMKGFTNLKEVYMDNYEFYRHFVSNFIVDPNIFIFHKYSKVLKKILINNWQSRDSIATATSTSQDSLIKFVHNAPPSLEYLQRNPIQEILTSYGWNVLGSISLINHWYYHIMFIYISSSSTYFWFHHDTKVNVDHATK